MSMLFERVRKNGKPIGIVVAIDKDHIGWSRCSKKDKWSKEKGKMIAINRARNGFSLNHVHPEVTPILKKMEERAKRYFK